MKKIKSLKRKLVSAKIKKKKADLFRLKNRIKMQSIKTQINLTIISIKARNMNRMRKNMSLSILKKLMMILIFKKENKIIDCLHQGILQKGSSEVHQLIQEELQLD